MSELLVIPLLGLYLCYAWIASDGFRSLVKSRKKTKWIRRWWGDAK